MPAPPIKSAVIFNLKISSNIKFCSYQAYRIILSFVLYVKRLKTKLLKSDVSFFTKLVAYLVPSFYRVLKIPYSLSTPINSRQELKLWDVV